MRFADFSLRAMPFVADPNCPNAKCGKRMVEMDNGWLSKVWWCPHCEKAYELGFVKIKNHDRKVIDAQLKEIEEEKKWRESRKL